MPIRIARLRNGAYNTVRSSYAASLQPGRASGPKRIKTAYQVTEVREPLHLIVPVWGAAYVERFLDLAAPSWLAEGNLPSIASRTGSSIRIVTRAADAELIRCSPIYDRLAEIADIRFLAMDDLLAKTSTYVTLTLAYHRGLLDVTAGPGPRTAVLLNSDFILGTGSLAAVRDRLDAGERAILAPSLRAVEEDIAPMLLSARQSAVELSASPRQLVAMAFKALHPTVLCARMDQGVVRSKGAHQYFWRPEPETLIGRGFCLFPLAARIEGPLPKAEAFCDYGLLELLVPDVRPSVLNDSDDFFALELAPLDHEADFFRLQPPREEDVVRLLGEWSLQFHRDQAAVPLFYRAAAPGRAVNEAVRASQAFVDRMLQSLPEPLPIRHHPVWLSAVAAWRTDRAERGVLDLPPELAPVPEAPLKSPPGRLRSAARTMLAGRPGYCRPWHPRWRLAKSLDASLAAARRRGLAIHVVGHSLFSEIYPLDVEAELPQPAGPLAVLIGAPAGHPAKRRELMSVADGAMARAEAATLLTITEEPGGVDKDSIAAMFSWAAGMMDVEKARVLDLRLDDWARHTHGRLADRFSGAPGWRKAMLVGASAAALAITLLRNLAWAAGLRRSRPRHVSAVVFEAVRRRG